MATNQSSCLTGDQPVLLNPQNDCSLGFYCPNNSNANPPQYCPPTIGCQTTRLGQIHNTCQQPQGVYEPIVCPPGYYCPLGGKSRLPCPKHSFCPIGSFAPTPCAKASICPNQSQRQIELSGVIALLVFDVFGALLFCWCYYHKGLQRRRRRSVSQTSETPFRGGHHILASQIKRRSAVRSNHQLAKLTELGITDHEHESAASFSSDFQSFIESSRDCFGDESLRITFNLKDVGYTLVADGRQILADITCSIDSGSVWGVMGASGSGKSTYLNVLMGKLKHSSGDVFVNKGSKSISEYKQIIGYVPQDDIIMSDLTVRENILHSARMRLPTAWSERRINEHVDALLGTLMLSHVQHSRVGDSVRPVISGGQRKRVSIGMELVAAPKALFLDEPTSGLDATSALHVMTVLKALSRCGVTVVCVIHQPRKEIYDCLDDLLLLSDGRQVFCGQASSAQEYFSGFGFVFQNDCNPADTIMDIVTSWGPRALPGPSNGLKMSLTEQWACHQSKSTDLVPNLAPDVKHDIALQQLMRARGASWVRQVWFCFERSIRQQLRDKAGLCLEIAVGAASGILIGLSVYELQGLLFQGVFRAPYQILSTASNYTLVPQLSLLCSLAIGLAGSAAGVRIFGDEKEVYRREAFAGHSRSAYYLGKVVSTFIRIPVAALHFTVFFVILATPLMSFGRLYLVNVIYYYCIYGLASCVSVVVRKEDGPLLSVMLSLITGIFCGYGPSLSLVKSWHLEWFWFSCPGTWFAEAYYTDNLQPLAHLYDIETAADFTGYRLNRYCFDAMILFVIGTIYRLLAYFGLILWPVGLSGR